MTIMYRVLGSDQKVYGPVSTDQVRSWLAEGRVNSATLLQAESSTQWLPVSAFPEFGGPPVITPPPPVAAPCNDQMAVAGLVFGVLSWICCCFSPLFSVLGIICSALVLSKPQQNSRTMAIIGLILSILSFLWHSGLLLFSGLMSLAPYHFHHWRNL